MKRFFSVVLFFICNTVLYSQALSPNDIDQLVERTLKAFDVPGISVGIIKDGKVIHAKGYGVRSLNS